MGIAPTGKRATIQGISIVRVAGGRVVEESDQLDIFGLLQQQGAIPPPGEASARPA